MDEQLLRARLAALDQANLALNYSGMAYGGDVADIAPAVQTLAEAFETWLTRPTPVDAIMDKAMAAHDVETTADRLGYPRCPTGWKNTANLREPHACRWAPGHTVDHECACGAVLDTP